MIGNGLQDDNLLAVGRELEALHVAVGLAHLAAVAAVELHGPYLTAGQKGNGLVIQPGSIGLVLAALGQQLLACSVGVHHVEHMMAFVLLHAVVAHLIDNVLSVG